MGVIRGDVSAISIYFADCEIPTLGWNITPYHPHHPPISIVFRKNWSNLVLDGGFEQAPLARLTAHFRQPANRYCFVRPHLQLGWRYLVLCH